MTSRVEKLGNLGSIGFGCLQLEDMASDEKAVEVIVEAYRLGVRVFDTAAVYGNDRHNEKIVGQAIKKIQAVHGKNANMFFSTKCGINFATTNTPTEGYEGSPDQIRASVDLSLKTLGVDRIPLLYLHRINPKASEKDLQATFDTLKELVEKGKVHYVGLSEPTAAQIVLADEVLKKTKATYNPFAFVQSACSVASQRAFKNGVLETCQKNGIQFVSYTAQIRGLTDDRLSKAVSLEELAKMEATDVIQKLQTALEIPKNDFRFFVGFFHESVLKTNIQCILRFQKIAQELHVSSSELALAWQKANKLLPIPGTKNLKHLQENVNAMKIDLTTEQLKKINECFQDFQGNPNPPKMLDNEDLQKV